LKLILHVNILGPYKWNTILNPIEVHNKHQEVRSSIAPPTNVWNSIPADILIKHHQASPWLSWWRG
jgi:hypothetical protein